MTLTQQRVGLAIVLFAICFLFVTQPAFAADIFAAGKQAIKDSAGKDSAAETAILGSGLIGATVAGLTTRNWLAAAGGFIGGNIFWAVGAPMVGLA